MINQQIDIPKIRRARQALFKRLDTAALWELQAQFQAQSCEILRELMSRKEARHV